MYRGFTLLCPHIVIPTKLFGPANADPKARGEGPGVWSTGLATAQPQGPALQFALASLAGELGGADRAATGAAARKHHLGGESAQTRIKIVISGTTNASSGFRPGPLRLYSRKVGLMQRRMRSQGPCAFYGHVSLA